MSGIFSMLNSKKEFRRFIISLIIFFVVSILCDKIANIGPNTLELKIGSAIPPAFGLYLGPIGALGVAIGDFINSLVKGNYDKSILLLNFGEQFLYAYIPYKLWYIFNTKNRLDIPNLNNVNTLIKYILILFIDVLLISLMKFSTCAIFIDGKVEIKDLIFFIFNNFNFQTILGIMVIIIMSSMSIRPHIPISRRHISKSRRYEYLLYGAIIIGSAILLMTYINIDIYKYKKIYVILIAIMHSLCLLFVLAPINNKSNVVHLSKMRLIFSIKGKVTVGLLIFSIIFVIILVIVSYISLITTSNIDESIYRRLCIVIGLCSYFVFFLTIIVSYYVEKRITTPIQNLATAVEEFSITKYDKGINQKEIQEKCEAIKTGDEIEDLARAFSKMMIQMEQYVKNLSNATRKIENEETELIVARKIQLSMLPNTFKAFPKRKDFEIYAKMSPAKEVGGDFYDFFIIKDQILAFVIADVSGKGVPAALFMMTVKTTIKNLFNYTSDISKVVEKVNNELCENNDTYMFATAFIALIDLETGIMTYINAGHNPPLIKRKDGRFQYLHVRNNCILAIMPNAQFEKQEIVLNEGDLIFAYTDGVTEAIDENGGLYGVDKLKDELNSKKNINLSVYDIIPSIQDSILDYARTDVQSDDITMLAFKYIGL